MVMFPCGHRALPPGPMKKVVDPRLIGSHELVQRANRDFLVHEDGEAAADGKERREVVGDDDDRDAEAPIQLRDERIDATRGERIEIGGGLVEKENPRIQRERPGKCGAFHHAAGKLGRKLDAGVGSMTFWATESEENRAPCWNRTPKSDAFSAGPSASTGLSPTRTSPLSGRCRPASVLSRTDLPDPEPPAMPRTSPRRTSRLIPSCTFCVPNRFTTSRAETIGLRCRCVAGFIGPASRTGWRTAHPARSRQ